MGSRVDPNFSVHIVAIPYPGRGHVNPLKNLCTSIATARPDFLITFVVTEEWLSLLTSKSTNTKPVNVRLRSIPNVVPSERTRAKDFAGFLRAVSTDMEAPVDRLVDSLGPVNVIFADVFLSWVLGIGQRRNIPVASFWSSSPTIFSIRYHEQLGENLYKTTEMQDAEKGEELVKDVPIIYGGKGLAQDIHSTLVQSFLKTNEAKYLVFTSIADFESPVVEALRAKITASIHSIGPTLPHHHRQHDNDDADDDDEHLAWLDAQPDSSVLYISQGSFMSVPDEVFSEIAGGVRDSGVRYFWVARERTGLLNTNNDTSGGDGSNSRGVVVPWCDQLRVLCHPAVGGFWTHCGWNSTKEGVFAGVPFLAFPIGLDQFTNCKMIVDDWRIGWRVKEEVDGVVKREEIAQLLRRFMDLECDERRELSERAKYFGEICRKSIQSGLDKHNLEAFIEDIFKNCNCKTNSH